MMPRLAIITRTKNRPSLLPRALESVLAQESPDWVHVIVNDGGDPDALESLLEPYRADYGDRLQVIHHEASHGMQAAANAGISASESEFIVLHDDDDSWDPAYVSASVEFLEKAGPESCYQGVVSHVLEVRERIHPDHTVEVLSRRPHIPLSEISLFRLGYENPFPPIAFCFRRSAFETLGPYNPRFNVAGDYDFNFRFLRRFEIGVIPRPLAFYHIRIANDGDPAAGNSISDGATEHKRRYNEFKNFYLRGEAPEVDPAQRLALNAGKYLVELEWIAHAINREVARIRVVEERVEHGLQQEDEAFATLQSSLDAARNRIEDLKNDSSLPDRLDSLARDLAHLNDQSSGGRSVLDAIHQQLTEDTEALDRLDSLARDLAFLNDQTGGGRSILDAIHQRLTEDTEALDRLDSLARDLAYLNTQTGERHDSLQNFLSTLAEAIEGARAAESEHANNLEGTLLDRTQQIEAQLLELLGDSKDQGTLQQAIAEENANRDALLSRSLNDLRADLRDDSSRNNAAIHELARAHESRAVDILKEIQQHHQAMHAKSKETTLFQLGPLRLSWRKRSRKAPSSDEGSAST